MQTWQITEAMPRTWSPGFGCHEDPTLRQEHVCLQNVWWQENACMGDQATSWQNLGCRKHPLLCNLQKQEKFNTNRKGHTGGNESTSSIFSSGGASNNLPWILSNISAAINNSMSAAEQCSIVKYNNSLYDFLQTHSRHHVRQQHIVEKHQNQQRTMLDQQAKFLALLTQKDMVPSSPSPASCNQHNRTRDTKLIVGPVFCNSCKKDKCFHKDDDCFAF